MAAPEAPPAAPPKPGARTESAPARQRELAEGDAPSTAADTGPNAPDADEATGAGVPNGTTPGGGEPARWWARLGLAGRLDGAVGGDSGAATTTVGGELRAALGRGRWGLAAGAGALAPTLVLLDGASARQQRFPGYLVARLRLRSMPGLEVAFDAGLAAVLFQITGRDVVDAQSVLRADAGGRLSFECRLPALGAAGGWAPFVSLQAEYFPRTYRLLVDELGTVGTTPHLWLGASLGISFAPL